MPRSSRDCVVSWNCGNKAGEEVALFPFSRALSSKSSVDGKKLKGRMKRIEFEKERGKGKGEAMMMMEKRKGRRNRKAKSRPAFPSDRNSCVQLPYSL